MIEKCRASIVSSGGAGQEKSALDAGTTRKGRSGSLAATTAAAERAPSPANNQVITAAELVGRPAAGTGSSGSTNGLRRPIGARRKPGAGTGLAPPAPQSQRLGPERCAHLPNLTIQIRKVISGCTEASIPKRTVTNTIRS